MKQGLTDITLVVDRSGSMASIRDDAQGGVNAFIAEQREGPGEARVTLVQFDDRYEVVHQGIKASECPLYQLQPRGSTALLDAIGKTICETGDRLAALPEEERPELVYMIVMTDGMENASREFTNEQIREMVEHQKTVYNWRFVFLSADLDAFRVFQNYDDKAAQFSPENMAVAFAHTGKRLLRVRKYMPCQYDIRFEDDFTPEERTSMMKKKESSLD